MKLFKHHYLKIETYFEGKNQLRMKVKVVEFLNLANLILKGLIAIIIPIRINKISALEFTKRDENLFNFKGKYHFCEKTNA